MAPSPGVGKAAPPLLSPATISYIAPFVAFLGFLALHQAVALPDLVEQILCLAGVSLVLLLVSRRVIDFRVRNAGGTVLIGLAVFAIWIAPDRLIPGYRDYWLFSNGITGHAKAGISVASRASASVLWLRAIRASVLVPILEELFWRAWMLRWLIRPDFENVPLGTYSRNAFWIVAVLFAAEHGPYWEVGLICGVIYNWWMIRTKSLGDLILAHAVTNGVLSAYVVFADKWEYWA